MIDVHVLTLPDTQPEWVEQRRASLAAAIANAPFPAHVHEVPGIMGHLGQSRARGYAMGVAPYVTHVDHDDYVTPDAFAEIAPLLREGCEAVTTGETHLYPSGATRDCPGIRHHLAVFRRDVIAPLDYASFRFYPDQFLLRHTRPTHVAKCLYVHRIWQDSASRTVRRANSDEARRELASIGNKSLMAVELMTAAQIAAEVDKEMGE